MKDHDDKVVSLATVSRDRQPQLTDAELVRIRAMLEQFEAIKQACPIARKVAGND
ncbi:hypothetical protein [Novilysobacter arseniciresistens]|uniref:hypothetical protein n=1 Tax=Novilysobacter arseniciresistens TaxID=1385522 RepID=UPI000A7D0962|nr:hypothetical protein [Lysobacter arseniciresistens]